MSCLFKYILVHGTVLYDKYDYYISLKYILGLPSVVQLWWPMSILHLPSLRHVAILVSLGDSSHQNISWDPSSVELNFKEMLLFIRGTPQSTAYSSKYPVCILTHSMNTYYTVYHSYNYHHINQTDDYVDYKYNDKNINCDSWITLVRCIHNINYKSHIWTCYDTVPIQLP